MLKTDDFIREFPVNLRTDRDCEAPVLKEWIEKIAPINSLLDVGAHSSRQDGHYAEFVRKHVQRYDGIDILHDPITAEILDHYFIGNANLFTKKVDDPSIEKWEVVICVSTIEHAGLSTYKGDYIKERNDLFKNCLELAKKYVWISFPVGQKYTYPNQLSIITKEILTKWEKSVKDYKVTQRFFYNQGPQAGHPWYEHKKREVALKIPYIDFIGNQSICVMEIEKI